MRARERRERPREVLERRVARWMIGRLVVAGLVLALAAALGRRAADGEIEPARLYATVACAFVATLVYGAWSRRVQRLEGLAWLQVVTDVGVVTALVAFSGALDSIFTFLYVPITVYAAMVLGRTGAYGSAAVASLAYATVIVAAREQGFTTNPADAPLTVEMVAWGAHTAALLLAALLASALSSERDRADRALDERTRDLRTLQRLHQRTVESLTSGLLTTDLSGRITSFNPEAERITGLAAEEAMNRSVEDVLPGVTALVENQASWVEARMRSRMPYRSRSGEEKYLGLAASILRAEDGSPSGRVIIFQDVTRVVEMEGELRRKERLAAAGRLAASLAHEIRNPLAAISGSIQMLQKEARPAEDAGEGQRLMSIVLRETDRLDALIRDFLQYARPAAPRRKRIDLDAFLAETREMFERAHRADVRLRFEPSGLSLHADPDQLRQLFWNLCRNAAEAMPDGGEVRIEAAQTVSQGGHREGRRGPEEGTPCVEVRVSDTGAGIADEHLDRIFDPFFTTKADGTGLGLATVHRIVEAHGGDLSVETRAGKGTTFCLRFPCARETR